MGQVNILIINSTEPELYIALTSGSKINERTCGQQRAHDKNLNKLVKEVLAEANLTFTDISAFAVVTGPGSWTGCRVGVAAVKAYANACPAAKIIELRAPTTAAPLAENRAVLIKTAKQKFAVGDFTPSSELTPFYNGEFQIKPKPPARHMY